MMQGFFDFFSQLALWMRLLALGLGLSVPVLVFIGIRRLIIRLRRRLYPAYPTDTILVIRRAPGSDLLTLSVRDDANFSAGQLAAVLGLTGQGETGGWEEVSFFEELH